MATEKKKIEESVAEEKKAAVKKSGGKAGKKTDKPSREEKSGNSKAALAAKKAEAAREEERKFMEKLEALKKLAVSKRNVLELTEINGFFNDIGLDEEKTEKVIDFLENNNVDVLRIPEGKETDEEIMLEMEGSDEVPDDEEIEKIDCRVCLFISRSF